MSYQISKLLFDFKNIKLNFDFFYKWDMFDINELEAFELILQNLYKSEKQKTISIYEKYRAELYKSFLKQNRELKENCINEYYQLKPL